MRRHAVDAVCPVIRHAAVVVRVGIRRLSTTCSLERGGRFGPLLLPNEREAELIVRLWKVASGRDALSSRCHCRLDVPLDELATREPDKVPRVAFGTLGEAA